MQDKLGVIGITTNPACRYYSHNAGWSAVMKKIAEANGFEARILRNDDDWGLMDALLCCEGVNFRNGQWNLYGGVQQPLIERLGMYRDFPGDIYFYYPEPCPDYNDLMSTRKIQGGGDLRIPEPFGILEAEGLVIGDSHAISVYEENHEIYRMDGRLLFSMLRKGAKELFDRIFWLGREWPHVRIYFGNIDARFHWVRLGLDEVDVYDLAMSLVSAARRLRERVDRVSLVHLLPIEDESRRIPMTGRYKGQRFFGTADERQHLVDYFNKTLSQCWDDVLTWDHLKRTPEGRLDFCHMEAKSSVHLAPHSYQWKPDWFSLSVNRRRTTNKKAWRWI